MPPGALLHQRDENLSGLEFSDVINLANKLICDARLRVSLDLTKKCILTGVAGHIGKIWDNAGEPNRA